MVRKIFVSFVVLVEVALIIPLICLAEADGFRGIEWGADISALKDVTYMRTDPSYGGIQIYSRKGDELKIGGAELESINYGFWKRKFCSVSIYVRGYVNFEALKNAAFEKFNRGDKLNDSMESYIWRGEKTVMTLEYSEISKKGELWMYSREISEQQKKFESEKARKEAVKGFFFPIGQW